MKKISRFAVLVGLTAGVIGLLPAMAQDAPGIATEMMDGVDNAMQSDGPPQPPFPPMMPMAQMPPMHPMMMPGGMPEGPLQGGAEMMGLPDDVMAMHGGDIGMLRMGVHSSFSDDQMEKMYRLKSDFLDKAGPKMAELKSQERALHDLMTQPEFEKGKAQSIQSKINGLKDDLANLRLDQQIGLLNCLTADQRKELRRSYVKHVDFGMMGGMGGMHGMHGMRGMRGHGGCASGGWGGPHGRGGHHGDGGEGHHGHGGEGHHEHSEPSGGSSDKG